MTAPVFAGDVRCSAPESAAARSQLGDGGVRAQNHHEKSPPATARTHADAKAGLNR